MLTELYENAAKSVFQTEAEIRACAEGLSVGGVQTKDCCLTMLTKLYENTARSVLQNEAGVRACAEVLSVG